MCVHNPVTKQLFIREKIEKLINLLSHLLQLIFTPTLHCWNRAVVSYFIKTNLMKIAKISCDNECWASSKRSWDESWYNSLHKQKLIDVHALQNVGDDEDELLNHDGNKKSCKKFYDIIATTLTHSTTKWGHWTIEFDLNRHDHRCKNFVFKTFTSIYQHLI